MGIGKIITELSDLILRPLLLPFTAESSAFQLFIFHIYILSFSFFIIIRNANSH